MASNANAVLAAGGCAMASRNTGTARTDEVMLGVVRDGIAQYLDNTDGWE